MSFLITVAICGVLIIILEFIHHRERRDLYNRLMAKDLTDYKANENGVVPKGRNGIKRKLERINENFSGGLVREGE